jgi:hypothetical protein
MAVLYGVAIVFCPLGVGKTKKPKTEWDAVATVLVVLAVIYVLWAGGFWS